jgi:hypothetical protein
MLELREQETEYNEELFKIYPQSIAFVRTKLLGNDIEI